MEFTLFEVHLPSAEFNAPFSGRETSTTEETEREVSGSSSLSRLPPIAALLALVGVALLARYLRGGEAEQTTLDEVPV